MTLITSRDAHESGTRTWTRPKYLASVAVSLVLATGLATPAMADSVPAPSIGDAVATGDAVEVHTTAVDPMTEQQVLDAEKKAKAARKAAQAAVAAKKRAKHHEAVTLARAYRQRTAAAIREYQAAHKAAKHAATKAKKLKKAAKKATQQARALRQAAMSKGAGSQRRAIAPAPNSTSTDRNRSAVMDLANQARALAGCDPLNYNTQLERSAQAHALDMARNHYLSHTSLDGRTFDQRIRATGYDGGRIGENIGSGFGDPNSIMNAWMHSPAHKANILDCRFRNIGVGYVTDGGYWVQNFGS
jgi:uncharacterized protein YkwD